MAKVNRREQEQVADRQRRLAALERIREHREKILAEHGGEPLDFDVVEAIQEAREEQDEFYFPSPQTPARE
jgi:hypothetical protein